MDHGSNSKAQSMSGEDSRVISFNDFQIEGKPGRRLRVEGNKRNEEETRQMLRLAEAENHELRSSLRYVEI